MFYHLLPLLNGFDRHGSDGSHGGHPTTVDPFGRRPSQGPQLLARRVTGRRVSFLPQNRLKHIQNT